MCFGADCLPLFCRLGRQALDEKKRGHTAKALYCMKRKKSLQEILEKRLKSMETMDTVLMKIESSQDDLQVRTQPRHCTG